MAGVFNYKFKSNERFPSKPSVVKYWFGTKYFIWKCLHLKQSCEQVFKDLNTKIAKGTGALPPTDLFFKVVKHQKSARVTIATVEVLFQSDAIADILQVEREILFDAAGDSNCLNISFDQYLPGWAKSAASNKALQSIISDSVIGEPVKEVDKSPEPKKRAPAASPATNPSGEKQSMSKSIEKMRSLKARLDGKN